MYSFLIIIFFIFGTIIGSFLNVVTLRMHTGRTIGGRSFCFSCGKNLRWFELIPVISFFMQRGKCRRCKTGISMQYPIVEITTGLIFSLIAVYFFKVLPFSVGYFILLTGYFMVVFSFLISIVVYDFHHKIIPNSLVYPLIIISIIGLFLPTGLNSIYASWYNIFAGIIIAIPFALIWLVSKGKWMGLGDPKLMLAMGTILGFSSGVVSIVISFWIAAIVGIGMIILKKAHRKTEVPFAPFLAIGFAIAFFCQLDIFSLLSFLS